jgi:hypothetical protein
MKQKDLVGAHLEEGRVIPELSASVARAPRSRASPVEATRKSIRSQCHTEGSVLERAMRAAADKDSGNNKTKSISDFTVLQDSPADILLSVAKDSYVVFPSASGSPIEALSLIRAKELAQAELALARHKIEIDLAREKGMSAKD